MGLALSADAIVDILAIAVGGLAVAMAAVAGL